MTAEPTEPTEPPKADPKADPPKPPKGDGRLPDDHPAVQALKKANAEAADLRIKVKKFEDASKSETEKLAGDLETAQADAKKAQIDAARLRAVLEHGLSIEDLDLIGGDTPEDIRKRAKKLAERLKTTSGPPASRNQGGDPDPPQPSVQALIDSIPRL